MNSEYSIRSAGVITVLCPVMMESTSLTFAALASVSAISTPLPPLLLSRSGTNLPDQGMDVNATSKRGYTPLDVAMGKTIVGQLPVPQERTVALLKKLGGTEGPGPRAARPPSAQ